MRKIILSIFFVCLTTLTVYAADAIRILVAPKTVEFNVENPSGLITGYTPTGIITNIPYLKNYSVHMEPSMDGPMTPYEEYHLIEYDANIDNRVIPGKYKLTLFGINTPYKTRIAIEYWWMIGISSKGSEYDNYILTYPNSVWTYEFDIPSTPPTNNQIVLTKVSTPADLIKDITTAGQLGYIGNTKFVAELTKEINEIEAEKAKGKIDDGLTPAQKAKKEYTGLLSEITEKYNKPEGDEFVKKEAYDVLREDLEYIIGHM